MRPERLYLLDMIEAADDVVIHIAGRDRNAFMGDVTARSALQNAASVASLLLTTEALITEIPDKKKSPAPGQQGFDQGDY